MLPLIRFIATQNQARIRFLKLKIYLRVSNHQVFLKRFWLQLLMLLHGDFVGSTDPDRRSPAGHNPGVVVVPLFQIAEADQCLSGSFRMVWL